MSAFSVLAVDVGTTAIKAAVYAADGRLLSAESKPNRVLRSLPGWAEQDMDEVWGAVKATIVAAVAAVEASRIAAIGVCGQGDGLWALDAERRPLRNAMLWSDARADELVLGWIASGASARLSRFSRTSNWAGTAGTLFRWLKLHEPEAAGRVAHVLFCKDWINFKLTGALTTDFSDATIPFLDLETRAYADEAFALLGVAELKGKLAEPRRATGLNGLLSPRVAAELGLKSGLPVAVGAIDLGAMMTGLGLDHAGDVGLALGTTAMVNVVTPPAPFAGEPIGATLAHPFNDNWIRVFAPVSGTATLDWFAATHLESTGAEAAERVADLARRAPPGARGLIFLPFLAGERAPFVAPQATASFSGLKASTTLADLARAVMEGTAFSLRHCFEATGIPHAGALRLTGGGARNRLWCDILASVLNAEIVVSDASDHGLWGVARIAAAAAGLADIDISPRRDEATRAHAPDPSAVAAYDGAFALYQETLAAARPVWPAQRALERRLTLNEGA